MEEIIKFINRHNIQMPDDKTEFAWKLIEKSKGLTILRQLTGVLGHAPIFSDITQQFLESYRTYCNMRYKKASADSMYGVVKKVLRENEDRAVCKLRKYGDGVKGEEDVIEGTAPIDIYEDGTLCNEEVDLLTEYTPTTDIEMKVFRNFMLSLHSGCSFFTAESITTDNYRNEYNTIYYREKDCDVVLPATHNMLRYISYQQSSEVVYDRHKANEVIKCIATKAGLGRKKCEKITIDYARRSFATRMYNAKVDEEYLAEILACKPSELGRYVVGYVPQKERENIKDIMENMYKTIKPMSLKVPH